MPLMSGMNAQFGYLGESTYGTAVTVTRFLPFVSESIKSQIARIESDAIFVGRRVQDASQWAAGDIKVAGQLHFEMYDHGMGLLYTHMFGGAAISGSGPFTQTYTPGLLPSGMTVQIGKPDTGTGTVQPFTYAGVKVGKWTLSCQTNQFAKLVLDVVAKSETTATALATASYPANLLPVTYVQGSLTVAAVALPIKQFTLTADNQLADSRRFLGSQAISEPLEAGLREYKGSLMPELTSLTAYNRFVNGTTAALVLTFTAGSNTTTITTNVRFDGETPNVSGRDIIEQPLNFKCIGTTDAAAITLVTVNSDAAA